MSTTVMIDGELRAPESATVSIFDRGFLYGDSIYEVMRVYAGKTFELGLHLERLQGSAERIGMSLPTDLATLAEEVRRAIAASGLSEAYVRVVVTRGRGDLGLDPGLAEDRLRLVLVMPLRLPSEEVYARGAKIQVVGVRRNHPRAMDPAAKTGNYLNSVLALSEAKRSGAHEAVMLDGEGRVTEGASSNVFAVLAGLVLTPPLHVGILPGITRRSVLEVCRREGRRVLELPITADTLLEADELFITSSIREIVPVVRVGEHPVGEGRPGPVVTALRAAFDRYVMERCRAEA